MAVEGDRYDQPDGNQVIIRVGLNEIVNTNILIKGRDCVHSVAAGSV